MDEWTNIGGAIDMKVYTEPMEDGPINLASKSSQPIVDSNSNQELPPDPATSLTSSPPTKELQSSTVSSVILEPMDRDGNAMERDSLSNIIVDPMDRVVLGSRSPGNIDMKQQLDSSSPGNTPTPTGCTSPGPMMEEEEIFAAEMEDILRHVSYSIEDVFVFVGLISSSLPHL